MKPHIFHTNLSQCIFFSKYFFNLCVTLHLKKISSRPNHFSFHVRICFLENTFFKEKNLREFSSGERGKGMGAYRHLRKYRKILAMRRRITRGLRSRGLIPLPLRLPLLGRISILLHRPLHVYNQSCRSGEWRLCQRNSSAALLVIQFELVNWLVVCMGPAKRATSAPPQVAPSRFFHSCPTIQRHDRSLETRAATAHPKLSFPFSFPAFSGDEGHWVTVIDETCWSSALRKSLRCVLRVLWYPEDCPGN